LKVYIYTFGCVFWENQPPPSPLPRPWDLCLNVQHLKDPNTGPGTDAEVRIAFWRLNRLAVSQYLAFIELVAGRAARRFEGEAAIAISCAGGFSRSVSLAEIAATRLRSIGWEVVVVHMDIEKEHPPGKWECNK
jgi:RNase adaptor protein for sRNA GlmZ degradation